MKNEPLPQLLNRCKAGENGAVASLVERFQPWLHRYSASIVRDEDLAEDAVQEAFAAALEKLDDLRDPKAFQDWLRQLARTHAYRILRKRRELPLAEDHDEPSNEPSPVEQLERKELRQKVREAIEALPPAARETTELFYLDDRACSEISDILQIPGGTVKRRLHDARKRLRGTLVEYLEDDEPKEIDEKQRDRDLPI